MSDTDDKNRKKTRVHVDEVKERHTTHWDLDVLPEAEVDRLRRQGRRARWWRHWRWLALAAGLLLAGFSALGLLLMS
ncbi:hypothetical protein PC39_16156 [Salinisphaera sp. PC39]|uniref:hypothetical protein n=1 Tax=Salinisphaera sp. PC39 TaxID=1304156 RepID=UPI00333ED1DE